MSADNGFYILRTNRKDGGFEWRMCHAMAIENIDYGDEYLHQYFGKSKVHHDELGAVVEAWNGYRDMITQGMVVEYGVQLIIMDREFPNNVVSLEDKRAKRTGGSKRPSSVA